MGAGHCNAYLVGLMGSSGSDLAFLATSEFSKVAMIVAFPVTKSTPELCEVGHERHEHLVVEDLGFAGLSAWDKA